MADQKAALHRAKLLLAPVPDCGQVNNLRTEPPIQVDSAFYPSGVGKSSIILPS